MIYNIRAAILAVSVAGAVPAFAVPTSTTASVALPGTSAAAQPTLAGTVVSDTMVPFNPESTSVVRANGTVQVRVVRTAAGTLDFYWKINVDAASRGSVTSILLSGFPAVAYDANWRSDGLGTVAPAEVRGLSVGGGQKFGFSFPSQMPVHAGQSSRFFFLKSSARNSGPGTAVLYFGNGNSLPIAISVPR